jgi:type I restriction enzyme S subunit
MTKHVPLCELVAPAEIERAGSREFTVLSMTSSAGLVPQASIFKKTIASRDLSSYKVVRPNQLVVGIHVDEGALGFSGASQVGIVSPAYTIWKLKNPDQVHIPYLDRFVRSPNAIAYFISNYRETAERRGKLTQEQFLALSVPFPPLQEQRRIASVLDQADVLRAKRREALAQLDTLAQSIFIEMFGDPATNPKGWPWQPLGSIAIKFSDGPFGSNLKSEHYVETGVRVVRLQNIGVGRFVDNDKAYISQTHFEKIIKHECVPGDVLVGTLGDPNLRACVQPSSIPLAINKADCVQIRVDPEKANAAFVSALLNHPSTERLAQDLKHGQTRVRISMGSLRRLKVPIPSIDVQREFARRINALDALRKSHELAAVNHIHLFKSLQHHAFRGEL